MRLNRDYQALKTEVAEVEKIRSSVYDIISAEMRREQSQRAKGMERYMRITGESGFASVALLIT